MPELPEVETIARGLRELIRGKRIGSVGVAWPRTDGRSAAASGSASWMSGIHC